MASFLRKVCIVTGSSSGLGEAMAIMLAKRGAAVTLCGRDVTRLETALTSCVAASGGHADRFLCVAGDVLDNSHRADIVQKTVDKFGKLDVLVANAGVTDPLAGILTATEESYDRQMDTNLKSVFFLIQKSIPHLEASKGNIVVNSSMSSIMATSPTVVYPMAKAALDHMVRCLAVDLGSKNIRINAVNPGMIPTRAARSFADDQAALDAMLKQKIALEETKQALAGGGVTKEAVAEAVCFLASDAANFVTGHCLPVEAGRRLTQYFNA